MIIDLCVAGRCYDYRKYLVCFVSYRSQFLVHNSLTRAILHDEEVYPEPSKFDPERFLKNESVSFELQPDPNFSFGYGRRYECASSLS